MVKYMDVQEFVKDGYLQEVNRQFFHPLGLALEVTMTDTGAVLSGIWDYRSDPEGILYAELDEITARHKSNIVAMAQKISYTARSTLLGFYVQPIDTVHLSYEEIKNGQA